MTKSTAKTLTLTATKAAPRKAAPLAVPKTATSYFIEGDDSAAKVSVVKTRSRLAAVPATRADVASVAARPTPAPAEAGSDLVLDPGKVVRGIGSRLARRHNSIWGLAKRTGHRFGSFGDDGAPADGRRTIDPRT